MATDSNRLQVHWGGHDMAAWDAAHAAALGSLQQDWAYGSAMLTLGVPVLRARVAQDGVPLAHAQFIVRTFGRFGSLALCSRGPVWLQPLENQTSHMLGNLAHADALVLLAAEAAGAPGDLVRWIPLRGAA